MRNHLGFVFAGDMQPEKSGLADAQNLAERVCIELGKLGPATQFPPKLLVLLVSPAYLADGRAQQLVPGIQSVFQKHYQHHVPLIGSSVGGVFFDGQVHADGAVLICLASKLLDAKVTAAPVSEREVDDAVCGLIRRLDCATSGNPLAHLKVLTFLPGHLPNLRPDRLLRKLSEAMPSRLPWTGGVSHSQPPGRGSGMQFTDLGVHEGAIVAARIHFDVPVASGLGWTLAGTEDVIDFDSHNPGSLQFENSPTAQALLATHHFCVLGKNVNDRFVGEVVVMTSTDGSRLRMLRDVQRSERLQVLTVDSRQLHETIVSTVTQPITRAGIENPVGTIAFHCSSLFRYHREIGLEIEKLLEEMSTALSGAPVVGGYFDGEIGVDRIGQSMCANWGAAALTFGDEMRDRAAWQRGVKSIADNAANLNEMDEIEGVLHVSLKMISDSECPGAVIWLVMSDGDNEWLVPSRRHGWRVDDFGPEPVLLHGVNTLAEIARSGPRFGLDYAGLAGQYFRPLRGRLMRGGSGTDPASQILGLLQVDLGTVRKEDTLTHVLDSLATVIESAIARVLATQESRITQCLDEARAKALSCESPQEGRHLMLTAALEAFGADAIYLRTLDSTTHKLQYVDGVGAAAEVTGRVRSSIHATDQSPSGQAWVRQRAVILNRAKDNTGFSSLSGRYGTENRDEALMQEALRNVGSMAVTVLTGERSGTVAVVARKPWSFYAYHIAGLETLAQRLRFVVEHLERKISSDFMLAVGEGLDDPELSSPLVRVASNFKKATHAQVVSLFIWDPVFKRYVLEAQDGWYEANWEGVAFYHPHEGFHGSVALERKPTYNSELAFYKRDTGRELVGSYNVAMFGPARDPAEDPPTEGLAIPLLLGGHSFGVLTALRVYDHIGQSRRMRAMQEPANQAILRQASIFVSGYVGALYLKRTEERTDAYRDRLTHIHDVFMAAPDIEKSFALCTTVRDLYEATSVALFEWGDKGLRCVAVSVAETLGNATEAENVDDTIQRVFAERQDDVHKLPVNESMVRRNHAEAQLIGTIDRATVVVPLDERHPAVLDIRWSLRARRDHVPHHKRNELLLLARRIGRDYERYVLRRASFEAESRAKALEETSSRRIRNMGQAAVQAIHESTKLHRLLNLLEEALASGEPITKLLASLKGISRRIDKVGEFIHAGVDLPLQPLPLVPLITAAVEHALEAIDSTLAIRVHYAVDERHAVLANEDWCMASFKGLVQNAFRAIGERFEARATIEGLLTITSSYVGQTLTIVFQDNGSGMTPEHVDNINRGILLPGPHPPAGLGIGLQLTKYAIEEQRGSLHVDSQEGFGTTITVILPAPESENP